MSDAVQVVEDAVECRVGLLTCLRDQNLGLNVIRQHIILRRTH